MTNFEATRVSAFYSCQGSFRREQRNDKDGPEAEYRPKNDLNAR